YGIGHFIVDNFHELNMLRDLTDARQQPAKVVIRVTPGVDADTHKYIMTGQRDSKFGFDIQSGQAEEGVKIALETDYLQVEGIHMHIGSQIFDTETYLLAMKQVLKHVKYWEEAFAFQLKVFNIGGG